jgi:hypothetical protein
MIAAVVGSKKCSFIDSGLTRRAFLVEGSSTTGEWIELESGDTLLQRAFSTATVGCNNLSDTPTTFRDEADAAEEGAPSKIKKC